MTNESQYTQDYISVLLETLQKKISILDQISTKNEVQRLILVEESLNGDAFEENLNGKAKLIEDLEKLNNGFELVYERVKDILSKRRTDYTEQIREMQSLIRLITEKSTAVQVQEQRNKVLADKHFLGGKREVQQRKINHRVAKQYYKNMNNTSVMEPQFMDSKK